MRRCKISWRHLPDLQKADRLDGWPSIFGPEYSAHQIRRITMDFRKELAALINKHSLENESNTPDFILADYLDKCLYAFDSATRDRTKWYKPE